MGPYQMVEQFRGLHDERIAGTTPDRRVLVFRQSLNLQKNVI